MANETAFLLQRVQPAMVGLIDGSLATLAPIFAAALATHKPHYAFIAGLASAIAVPFLIPHYHAALVAAIVVVGVEMIILAWIRWRFFSAHFADSLAWIMLAAAINVVASGALANAAG